MVECAGETASGQGVATDVIEAPARAYLRALTTLARAAAAPQPDVGAATASGVTP